MTNPSARIAPFLEFTPSASERALLNVMSAESTPISPSRFAAALESLSVGSLHLKAAEIRNQLAHLRSSNAQLAEFKDDKECADAISENEEVMRRFEGRIALLKAEVEKRGMPWVEEDSAKTDQVEPGEHTRGTSRQNGPDGEARGGGSIEDNELAMRMQAQINEELGADEDDGVHL